MRNINWDIGMCDVLNEEMMKYLVRHYQVDTRKLSGEEKFFFPRGSYGSLFFTKYGISASHSHRLPKIRTAKIASRSPTFRIDISNISPQIITFLLKPQYLQV